MPSGITEMTELVAREPDQTAAVPAIVHNLDRVSVDRAGNIIMTAASLSPKMPSAIREKPTRSLDDKNTSWFSACPLEYQQLGRCPKPYFCKRIFGLVRGSLGAMLIGISCSMLSMMSWQFSYAHAPSFESHWPALEGEGWRHERHTAGEIT